MGYGNGWMGQSFQSVAPSPVGWGPGPGFYSLFGGGTQRPEMEVENPSDIYAAARVRPRMRARDSQVATPQPSSRIAIQSSQMPIVGGSSEFLNRIARGQ